MKKLIAIITSIVMIVSMVGCSNETAATTDTTEVSETTATLTDGTYSTTVMSVGGPLTVEVTVANDKLEKVEVTEINDTPGIYDPVVEKYTTLMVENQSINLDAISGATLTSMFMKNAVKDALSQAGDVSGFQEKVTIAAEAQQDMECDVVVVGAGMAGLDAALKLSSDGYSVVLLEELAYLGGNAIESDQFAVQNGETWPEFKEFLLTEVPTLTTSDFGGGIDRVMPATDTDTSVMDYIISEIEKELLNNGVTILKSTPATDLVIENGEVTGVVATPVNCDSFTISAKGTLLTNGGFQGNQELIKENIPYATGAMRVGPSRGRGDVFTWLKDFDLATRDMDWELAMFYSVDPDTGFYADWGTLPTHFLDDNGDLITEETSYNYGTMLTYGICWKQQLLCSLC